MFPKTLQKQTGIRAPFVLNRDCMGAGIAAGYTATLAVLFVNRRMRNRTDGGVRGLRGAPSPTQWQAALSGNHAVCRMMAMLLQVAAEVGADFLVLQRELHGRLQVAQLAAAVIAAALVAIGQHLLLA
ncbi:hypothetical protein D9M68_148660 [compost metagenome]